MFGSELHGSAVDSKPCGTIRVNTSIAREKKPVWLVLLKLIGTLAMVTIGYVLILPNLPMALWESIAIATSILIGYCLIAYFVRPEANGDNMGWFGGAMNDPTRISDNVNRTLWRAHCMLGPGRFVSETLLDTLILLRLIDEYDEDKVTEQQQVETTIAAAHREDELLQRLEQRQREQPYQGVQQLSTSRYLDPARFEE